MTVKQSLKVINKLGSGSYSTVYKVECGSTIYAYKRNISFSNIDWCSNLKELDILTKLRFSPYIVKLHYVYFGDQIRDKREVVKSEPDSIIDTIHFGLELADRSCDDFIERSERNAQYYDHVHKLAHDIVNGLHHMHSAGIMHRDIKPSNILIFTEGSSVIGKLSDFGMSVFCNKPSGPKTPGTITPWYRPPEIILGRDYDYAADIWSLGCVLYELVADTALIRTKGRDDMELLATIIGILPYHQMDIDPHPYGHLANPKVRRSWYDQMNMSNINMSNKDEYCKLVEACLIFNKYNRADIGQIKDLAPSYDGDNVIVMSQILNVSDDQHIINCRERGYMLSIAIHNIFNERDNIPWYEHKIFFQGIDIFERYLAFAYDNPKIAHAIVDSQGRIVSIADRLKICMRFYVCLYMAYKYYLSMDSEKFNWKEFVGIGHNNITTSPGEPREFEIFMIDTVLDYNIYRPSLYEIVGSTDEKVITRAIEIYANSRT